MHTYIETFNNLSVPPKNNGYTYLATEIVFLPVYEAQLSITKRTEVNINLLEEMILQLVNNNVHELMEISNILGVDKKLLEITIADLYVKDMLYCSSNKCSLLPKGREAVTSLKIIERKKDILKNVYLDCLTGEVIVDYESIQFIIRCFENDRKLYTQFNTNDIDLFRKNINLVKEVFNNESNIYNARTKSQTDELISIDSIENLYVKFIKIPIYIYVSNSGYDIDIIIKNKKKTNLSDNHKQIILRQIRERVVLKKVFKKYKLRKQYNNLNLQKPEDLIELCKKFIIAKKNDDVLENSISDKLFSNRKLFEEEFQILFGFLVEICDVVDIYIDYLVDWSKNDSFINLINNNAFKEINIKYNNVYLPKQQSTISKIEKICIDLKNRIVNEKHDYYFRVNFDNGYSIIGCPTDINVIDNNTNIVKVDYYIVLLK